MRSVRAHPSHALLHGQEFRLDKVLKEDFFSVNVLYKNDQGEGQVLKLSDFRFLFGWMFRPLAMLISRREYRTYQRVAGIAGVPSLGPRYGRRGYFHRYIEGKTLFELPKSFCFPEDFFERLTATVEKIHKRRVVHLDLQKRGNIILSCDGRPYVIDYQISLHFKRRKGWFGALLDRVFRALTREDIYHLNKHRKRFQRDQMTEEELSRAERSHLNQIFYSYVGTPYRKVKRLIYPKGSNELIWYKWKRLKDRTERVP